MRKLIPAIVLAITLAVVSWHPMRAGVKHAAAGLSVFDFPVPSHFLDPERVDGWGFACGSDEGNQDDSSDGNGGSSEGGSAGGTGGGGGTG